MTLHKLSLLGVLLVAVSLLSSTMGWASSEKTPESCASLGARAIHCYKCGGDKKYLGKAAILPSYEEDNVGKHCFSFAEACDACMRRYNISYADTGYFIEYDLGTLHYTEMAEKWCVDEVGRP